MKQNLRVERTVKFVGALEEGYARYSRVPSATVPRRFSTTLNHGSLSFSEIGVKETVPNDWFDAPDVAADTYFYETGRDIAMGEDNHIVKTILKTLDKPSMEVEAPDEKTILPTIRKMLSELEKSGYNPSVLFSPISFMTPMMVGAPDVFQVVEGRDFVRLPETTLEIFWSNNYLKFDDFILADKENFSEWIFKSDSDSRLVLDLKPYGTEKHILTAKTVIHYMIKNSKAAIRVAISK